MMTDQRKQISGACLVLSVVCVTFALGFGGWNGTPYGWMLPAFWLGFSFAKFHSTLTWR